MYYLKNFKRKEKKIIKKQASTQKWLPFDKILEKGIIVSKNKYIKIIQVIPINYDLKSKLEKESILNSYKLFLKTCNFDIQILIQSKKEDLSNQISQVKEINKNEKNKKIKLLSEKYINYINQKNNENKSLSEIKPNTARNKLIKAFAGIKSNVRHGEREYNEMYISNPKPPMAVFAYELDYNKKIS